MENKVALTDEELSKVNGGIVYPQLVAYLYAGILLGYVDGQYLEQK